MSSEQLRRQLDSKRRKRVEAEKKVGEFRRTEARKTEDAAKAMRSAGRTSSDTTRKSKLRTASRRGEEAMKAGAKAAEWQMKAAALLKDESKLIERVAKAEQDERAKEERARQRERLASEREAVAELGRVSIRLDATESTVAEVLRELRQPKPEPLRILMLGSSAAGDLRIGREQDRIRAAVRGALHRDYVEFEGRGAATVNDLLDGITRFRPHVVHFSGHSAEQVIAFEEDIDVNPTEHVVSAEAFATAMAAPDEPPLLILLNSCHSAAQLERLVTGAVPFAIGMSDAILDGDAINYAAHFYAALANGQSLLAAHRTAQAALQLAGLRDPDLPLLAHADDVDPSVAVLVSPSAEWPG